MDKGYNLNLGPFNSCLEILGQSETSEYPSDFYGDRMFHYTSSDVVVDMALKEVAFVPIFILEDSILLSEVGNLWAEKNHNNLINRFELKIIDMIHNLSRLSGVDFVELNESRVVIPIKNPLEIHQRDAFLCGTLHFGLALFYNVCYSNG